MNGKIYAMYFSPTHTAKTSTLAIAHRLAQETGMELVQTDLTAPAARSGQYAFGPGDLLLFGFPVYGGRMPALLAKTLGNLQGSGSLAVPVAVYGNRDYDDALLEAADLLEQRGFSIVAAGAFIGEHSFSRRLAAGRPDEADTKAAASFASSIAGKLSGGSPAAPSISGNRPYKDALSPMPFSPKTTDACTRCMACVKGCPAAVIDNADPTIVASGCIQCHSCVKFCPVKAKYFDAKPLEEATARLEANFMARKEPVFFL
ncbi:MAG: 4Fe-4S dicluster domain-containing protein [Christensenellaceae bacterium]|jgi:ferredoxin/flavodoxin